MINALKTLLWLRGLYIYIYIYTSVKSFTGDYYYYIVYLPRYSILISENNNLINVLARIIISRIYEIQVHVYDNK